MNILIPMAGEGRRFVEAGFSLPKPLIEVQGKTMIERAVESLAIKSKYIFIPSREHLEQFPYFHDLLLSLAQKVEVIIANGMTNGPACTCLLAESLINNNEPLLIANCDQIMNWEANAFLKFCNTTEAHGIIVTYRDENPKNSFVQLDENNNVVQVVEKMPISDIATVGLYYWRQGKYFVKAAKDMIEKRIRCHNEYYVGPAYNQLLGIPNTTVLCYPIENPYLIGTPKDLKSYLQHRAEELVG